MEIGDEIDYVVGIDYGHGETSAAVWNRRAEVGVDIEDVDFGQRTDTDTPGVVRQTMPSVMAWIGDRLRIGLDALSLSQTDAASYRIASGFKSDPRLATSEQQHEMCLFMGALYRRILAKRTELRPGNHLVAIAAPSGWSQESLRQYEELARCAGLPLPAAGGVLYESRAALRHILERTGEAGPGKMAGQGCVVLDFGSSTLDITYFNAHGTIDGGSPVGASRVEQLIMCDLQPKQPVLKVFQPGSKYANLQDWIQLQLRLRKEAYFSDGQIVKSLNLDDDLPELEDERVKIRYLEGDVERLLTTAGYMSQVKGAIRSFIEQRLSGCAVTAAFLTGGASRMGFLRALVAEAFGIGSDAVYCDNQPSLIVSRGIVECAREELRHKRSVSASTSWVDVQRAREVNERQAKYARQIVPLLDCHRSGELIATHYAEAMQARLCSYIETQLGALLDDWSKGRSAITLSWVSDLLGSAIASGSRLSISDAADVLASCFGQSLDEAQGLVYECFAVLTPEPDNWLVRTETLANRDYLELLKSTYSSVPLSELLFGAGSQRRLTEAMTATLGSWGWKVPGLVELQGRIIEWYTSQNESEHQDPLLRTQATKMFYEKWPELQVKMREGVEASLRSLSLRDKAAEVCKMCVAAYREELAVLGIRD